MAVLGQLPEKITGLHRAIGHADSEVIKAPVSMAGRPNGESGRNKTWSASLDETILVLLVCVDPRVDSTGSELVLAIGLNSGIIRPSVCVNGWLLAYIAYSLNSHTSGGASP